MRRGPARDDVTRRCRGVRGFALLLHESDSRMSIDVVAPNGRVSPLEYWTVVSHDFSMVGERADWWLAEHSPKGVPVALVVPLDVDEVTEDRERNTESHHKARFWVVARVGADKTCVTNKVEDGSDLTARLRRAVESTAVAACLPGRQSEGTVPGSAR